MSVSEHRMSQLDQFAQSYNTQLEDCEKQDSAFLKTGLGDNVIVAKKCSENFLEEALKLPREEQTALLRAAQRENDSLRQSDYRIPALDIVFNGKTGDLAEYRLTYFHRGSPSCSEPEAIDLYRR